MIRLGSRARHGGVDDISHEDIEAELAAVFPDYSVEDPEFHDLVTAIYAYVAQLGGVD